jgi:ceramide glucosyltransferase
LTWDAVFAIPAGLAGCYYALALFAAWRFAPSQSRPGGVLPGVSILKPLHGCDDRLMHAIVSHAQLDYPEFELLLGVRENDTAALAVIRRAQERFPACAIRIVPVTTEMPNGKVGSLIDMAAAAKFPILVINDEDICVERDYLRAVAGPLANPQIGLVTALYRATGASFPARFEALGVATEFAPSVLVARLLGVAEFALGSTMAVRAEDLRRIGGFQAIGDYLADDYQLGAQITRLGLHVAFADTVVETSLGSGSWTGAWKHQVRWARTIRVSRPAGYYGYLFTQATFWACVAAIAGHTQIAAAVVLVRMAAGAITAGAVLKDFAAASRWWMMPVRDLFGFAVATTAIFGRTVEWRGMRLQLSRDGRIHRTLMGHAVSPADKNTD